MVCVMDMQYSLWGRNCILNSLNPGVHTCSRIWRVISKFYRPEGWHLKFLTDYPHTSGANEQNSSRPALRTSLTWKSYFNRVRQAHAHTFSASVICWFMLTFWVQPVRLKPGIWKEQNKQISVQCMNKAVLHPDVGRILLDHKVRGDV